MAYRAFVVGANYGLKYAVDDAQRIARSLQKLGYELWESCFTSAEEGNHALIASFKSFAATCAPEDTMLFYFAGHGIVYKGLLYFVLENYNTNQNPLKTCLSLNDISSAFQASDASNKLMILDCCHAGNAFRLADFDFSDNYLVITASESFEKALEIEDHKAGILSHYLYNALTKDLAKVAKNSKVKLNALLHYLRYRVTEHNKASPDKVPQITVVSKQKYDMVVAVFDNPFLSLCGLVCVNSAFLSTERDKTGSHYTPENFYGALPPVQWWGVTNGLVAEQSMYGAVVQHVHQAIQA
ncbi:MAG: caspase family protein, partial [Candidatus Omnitrophica bacterium]|nr:caspase family protein [Candidatus Omnitrophota bacterium]